MPNIVYIATSLDGFIATKDGGLEWLDDIPNPDGSDFGFEEFINRIDAIVMGRKTFEKVLSFGIEWPYTKPVFVLSYSLKELPSELISKCEIVNGKPADIVEKLNTKGYNNLYIDGGKTIQSFLSEDIIDEMIISLVPVLLGDGIPLFGKDPVMKTFEHINTEIFENHLVKSHYIRKR